MIWIKSVLVGLAAAILTAVVAVVIVFAPLAWALWIDIGEGSGGIGAFSVGIIETVFLPAIIGFALGFWWSVRRERRRRSVIAPL